MPQPRKESEIMVGGGVVEFCWHWERRCRRGGMLCEVEAEPPQYGRKRIAGGLMAVVGGEGGGRGRGL